VFHQNNEMNLTWLYCGWEELWAWPRHWSTFEKVKTKVAVLLIEKESRPPCASKPGNNSGVLHSGLYYKLRNREGPIELSAVFKQMIAFCREHGIAMNSAQDCGMPRTKLNCPRWKISGNACKGKRFDGLRK